MGEIRRLRLAERQGAATVAEPKWGVPQRFLLLGIALILSATVIVGVLGYQQYTANQTFELAVQRQREAVRHLPPWAALQFYRGRIAPGIESPLEERLQGRNEMMAVGMIIAGLMGSAGVVFAAIGVVGLSRRKRGQ
jgi:hypothetical protein